MPGDDYFGCYKDQTAFSFSVMFFWGPTDQGTCIRIMSKTWLEQEQAKGAVFSDCLAPHNNSFAPAGGKNYNVTISPFQCNTHQDQRGVL